MGTIEITFVMQRLDFLEEKAKLNLYVLFHRVRSLLYAAGFSFSLQVYSYFKLPKHLISIDLPLNQTSSGYKGTLNTNT
jgi:hypothetical protein